MSLKRPEGVCKIHNVRFYNLTPRAINSMAYNRDLFWLALTRYMSSKKINYQKKNLINVLIFSQR